jgi:hypothetical protein
MNNAFLSSFYAQTKEKTTIYSVRLSVVTDSTSVKITSMKEGNIGRDRIINSNLLPS